MARKIRKIIDGKVQWFGGFKSNSIGQLVYTSPMLEITDKESYLEGYRYNLYNLLNTIKKELPDADIYVYNNNSKDKTYEIAIKNEEELKNNQGYSMNDYIGKTGIEYVFEP